MAERGYIVETMRGWRGRMLSPIYWVTKGSATRVKAEAGLFTREEFDAIHRKDTLTFVPVEDSPNDADVREDQS